MKFQKIIISRTDNIGDVVLALPVAGAVKKYLPGCKVIFMGKTYTRPVIDCCENIDGFLNYDELKSRGGGAAKMLSETGADAILHVFPVKGIAWWAKKAGIPVRAGTSHRLYHFFTCNKLVNLGRKNSSLHESQLNLKLLSAIGVNKEFPLNEIPGLYGMTCIQPLEKSLSGMLNNRHNLIIHPGTKGSSKEWGMHNFSVLATLLAGKGYKIFITGSENEGKQYGKYFDFNNRNIINVCGKFNLSQFISFIHAADGLVSCSTGPLHIAAAIGKFALGLYPPIKPLNPARWAPLGTNAHFLCAEKKCNLCRGKMSCACMELITPLMVVDKIESLTV